MKKMVVLFMVAALLVSQAQVLQAGSSPRASQAGLSAAKMINAYNRLNRANKQSSATSPSGQTKSSFNSPANVNPTVLPGAPSPATAPGLSAGDRPFDPNVSTINPFGPAIPSPGTPSSLPVTLGSGNDPFSPGQSTVNPFISANPSTASPFLVNPQDGPPSPGVSPGYSMTAIPTAPIIRKPSQPQLGPKQGSIQQSSPLSSNPYSSLSVSDPLGASRNPYSLNGLFQGSPFQPIASP
jgi:hypothetical protein